MKLTSHCELLSQRMPNMPIPRKIMRMFSTVTEFDKNKRLVKTSSFSEYNVNKSLKGLAIDDFSISSLQAVGADLHMTSLSLDNHAFVSDLKAKLSDFDSKNNPNNK